jgi:beta-1,4-N-acetylglucosaminyltransferase
MKKKVMFISSCGGHLSELLELKPMFNKYDYEIITEYMPATKYLKSAFASKAHYLIYGTKKEFLLYPFVLLINSFISLFYYLKYHPHYIVTTGTHTAGPMCCIGKLFGSKIIYIETFANIHTKTVTGSLIYHFADLFVVQWASMLKIYPKATYGGWIY